MHQFDLTDDQRQIQEMAQKFTADAITPFAAEWDEKHIFPRDTIRQADELGFGSIYVTEESGGSGLGRLGSGGGGRAGQEARQGGRRLVLVAAGTARRALGARRLALHHRARRTSRPVARSLELTGSHSFGNLFEGAARVARQLALSFERELIG